MANKKRTSIITAEQIKQTRGTLTQTQAANLVGLSLRQWRNYESGQTSISEAVYESFERKIAS